LPAQEKYSCFQGKNIMVGEMIKKYCSVTAEKYAGKTLRKVK
jgi:phage regulator Rha-like protein